MKQIVCLATSPWYPIPTRKQQVMSRIPDAEILYFDPSATIIAPLRDKTAKPLMTAWKQPGEKVKDNITVYRLPPVLPFFNKCRAINRVNQKNIAKFVREKMKEHGFEKPLLWVYSRPTSCSGPPRCARSFAPAWYLPKPRRRPAQSSSHRPRCG